MFLEKSDLVKLTGYVQINKQKKILASMGIAFVLRESDNQLLVLSDDVVNNFRASTPAERAVTRNEEPEPEDDHDPRSSVGVVEELSGFSGR